MGAARWRRAGHARPQGRADRRRTGATGSRRHRQGQSRNFRCGRGVRRRHRSTRQERHQSQRAVRRPAFPDEGSRPDDAGPPAGNGFAPDARQSRHGRYVPDRQDASCGPQPDRAHDDAGVRRLQFGRQSRRLCHAQSLEYGLHHLRLVGRQRRDGRGRRGADRARHRRRRLDPHSGRRQRQYRAEGLARRVLAGAA